MCRLNGLFFAIVALEFTVKRKLTSAFGANNTTITTSPCSDIATECPPYCFCSLGLMDTALHVECQDGDMTAFPAQLPKCDDKNLQYYLNFSGNMLVNLTGDIAYANRVVDLDVSNNKIQEIEPRFFHWKQYSVFRALYLHDNFLVTLPPEASHVLVKYKPKLTLRGNPWRCDCQIFWLKEFMKGGTNTKFNELICDSPQQYANHSFVDFVAHAQCDNPAADTGLPEYAVVLICLSVGYVALASILAILYTIRRRVKVETVNKAV